ncbi:toll/interleukin-1 receptor domain-containing protein [Desulfococcaceae bacterium HSG7]|nr:toll/interleukin-1 receptor domain-containing protein [Desulfococcaceae bacterium HSG7]
MTKTYKPRLIVYIVWHPAYKDGQEYAEFLYSLLTRNVKQPVSRGLGIPVFFRNVVSRDTDRPLEIKLEDAQQSAVVVLVDDAMVASEDGWNTYLHNLWRQTKDTASSHRLYPISMTPNAFNLDAIAETNFIRLHNLEPDKRRAVLAGNLIHELCRLMLNQNRATKQQTTPLSPAPVKLFISHAKQDGKQLANDIRAYMHRDLALKTFFDATDIAPGYLFADEIDANLEDAALLIILTDSYASRPWCRREVIKAKQLGCPMIVVNAIKKGEERSFPYLGNIPTVRWNPSPVQNNSDLCEAEMQTTINLTLREVLKNVYLKQHFKNLTNLFLEPPNALFFSRPPELMTLLHVKHATLNRENRLLYPDPPLGDEELNLLSQFAPELQLITPILLGRQI